MLIKIIYAIAVADILFAIGAIARHLKYIAEEDISNWSRLIIDFLFPLLIFYSIVKNFQVERVSELWTLPLIGFGLMLFGALIGYPLLRGIKSRDNAVRATFHHLCAVNNYSFLPIIILANLWGEKLLPILFILNIGSTVAYWTIGIATLGAKDIKQTLRNIVSPNLIAVVLALAITLLGLKAYVPDILMKIFGSLGACAVPVLFIIIGASLYGSPKLFHNKRDITYLTIVRLVLIPVLSILILKMLPLPKDVYHTAFIVSIMPVSVSSTLITRVYGGSPDFAAQAALVTTIASLGTIPLLLYFL